MPFYPRKLKHDFLIDGGLEVTGNTTITGTLTQTGVATFAAAPVLSAGIASLGAVSAQKAAVTLSTGGYVAEHVQALTGAGSYTTVRTGTPILGYGVTKISVTKAESSNACNFAYVLANPSAVGAQKFIFVNKATGASTQEIKIMSSSTLVTFYGTTSNAIVITSDAMKQRPVGVHLIGLATGTTRRWAVLNAPLSSSTEWTVCGATKGNT